MILCHHFRHIQNLQKPTVHVLGSTNKKILIPNDPTVTQMLASYLIVGYLTTLFQ
jgi:hypothetical protein